MILQEYLEVNITSKNMKYYKDLGYNIEKKGIYSIKNEDIQQKSRILEIRKCDCCGMQEERIRARWTDSFDSHGKDLCSKCGKKATQEKIKKINLEKYGVEYPMQSKGIKEKVKQTSLKKYGVEHPLQSKEAKENRIKSIQNVYGVSNVRQISGVNDKIKETNLNKYGSENVFGCDSVKEKIKETNKKKYNCENPSQNKEIQEKKKQTLKEHYGVEFALQSEEIREKFKQTCIENFGFDNPLKNKEIRAKGLKTLLQYGDIPTSKQQLELFELCKETFKEYSVELNYPLSDLALDIVLLGDNNLKIDIEYDGFYWHQNPQKDRRRDEFVKSNGFKVIRVKSKRKVPTIDQLKEAINYLLQNNKTFSIIKLSDYSED